MFSLYVFESDVVDGKVDMGSLILSVLNDIFFKQTAGCNDISLYDTKLFGLGVLYFRLTGSVCILEETTFALCIIGDTSDEIDTDRLTYADRGLLVSLCPYTWCVCLDGPEEEFEIVTDDNEEELEVFEHRDLFVLVDELDDDMLCEFSVLYDGVEILIVEDVSDVDDSSLDARYALNWCSDSAGVIDLSDVDNDVLLLGKVSFQISS